MYDDYRRRTNQLITLTYVDIRFKFLGRVLKMSTISIWGPTRENLSEKDASFNQNVDRKYEDSIDYDFSAAVTSKLQRNQSGRCDIVRGTLRRESRVLGIIGIDEKRIP